MMRVQPLFDVPNFVNIHVVDGHIFRIFKYVIYRDSIIIMRPNSPVMASSTCGDTVVLIVESGDLLVPHRDILWGEPDLDNQDRRIATFSFAMHIFETGKVGVVASPDGRYICIRSSTDDMLILEYDPSENTLTFRNSFELPGDFKIQVTLHEGVLCIWMLSVVPKSAIYVELYSVDPMGPFQFRHIPDAKCPLMTSDNGNLLERQMNIYVCASKGREGVLCQIDDQAYYIGYRQLIVGDFTAGLVKCEHPVNLVTTSIDTANTELAVYISKPDLTMTKIDPLASGHRVFMCNTASALIRGEATEFDFVRWRKYAVAVPPPISNTDEDDSTGHGESGEIKNRKSHIPDLIYAERMPQKISKFVIDSRKSPWKLITLGTQGIQGLSLAKKADLQANSGIQFYHKMCYEPTLQILICSSTAGENRYLRAHKDMTLPELRTTEHLIAMRLVGKHSLVLVYPSEVEIYSGVNPSSRIGSLSIDRIGNSGPILGAAFGSTFCALNTYDMTVIIDLSAHFEDTAPLPFIYADTCGVPISFISCQGDQISVGLDLSLASHRAKLHVSEIRRISHMSFLFDKGEPRGCIAIFNRHGVLIESYYHTFTPSGWHIFPNGDKLALYGPQGIATWLKRLSTEPEKRSTHSSSCEEVTPSETNGSIDTNMGFLEHDKGAVKSSMLIDGGDEDVNMLSGLEDVPLRPQYEPKIVCLEDEDETHNNFEQEVIDFRTSLEWGGVTPDGKGVLFRGTSLYIAARGTCERLAGAEEFGNKNPNYVTSTVLLDNTTIAYLEKQQLKFISDPNLLFGARSFFLRAETSLPTNSLEMLLIGSQRVLLLYGQGNVTFLDSATLEPLTLEGASPTNWRTLALWRFGENETPYEHLVVSDGKKTVESYTLQRFSKFIRISLKFRSSFPDSFIEPREPASEPHYKDLITSNNDSVYLCSGRSLKVIKPGYSIVNDETKLPSPALNITMAGDIAIVTCKCHVLLFKSQGDGKLRKLRVITRESVRMRRKAEFRTHVSQLVSGNALEEHLYILMASYEPRINKFGLLGIHYNFETEEVDVMKVPHSVRIRHPLLGVKDLVADPDAPRVAKFLRAYALMTDNSICSIEVFPPNHRSSKPIVKF